MVHLADANLGAVATKSNSSWSHSSMVLCLVFMAQHQNMLLFTHKSDVFMRINIQGCI